MMMIENKLTVVELDQKYDLYTKSKENFVDKLKFMKETETSYIKDRHIDKLNIMTVIETVKSILERLLIAKVSKEDINTEHRSIISDEYNLLKYDDVITQIRKYTLLMNQYILLFHELELTILTLKNATDGYTVKSKDIIVARAKVGMYTNIVAELTKTSLIPPTYIDNLNIIMESYLGEEFIETEIKSYSDDGLIFTCGELGKVKKTYRMKIEIEEV